MLELESRSSMRCILLRDKSSESGVNTAIEVAMESANKALKDAVVSGKLISFLCPPAKSKTNVFLKDQSVFVEERRERERVETRAVFCGNWARHNGVCGRAGQYRVDAGRGVFGNRRRQITTVFVRGGG
ncbi:hypothetical protein J6590_061546 [Homalodisca vitripennis]|nr:hypothetical protein J6590_061546 [Homalodisca vitripennis]